jgi:hypothetical protein
LRIIIVIVMEFKYLDYLYFKKRENGCYCLAQALTTVKKPYLCNCSYFLIAGSASCKKTSSLAVCGANLARSFAIVSPALEKTRSEGAEVAGMQRRR